MYSNKHYLHTHGAEAADTIPLSCVAVLSPEDVMVCVLNQRALKEIMLLQPQIKAKMLHIRTKADGTHLCLWGLSDIW